MKTIADVLRHARKDMTLTQFCRQATQAIRRQYSKKALSHLALHPEDRMAASAVVFSRLRREIWLVGDCQCLVNGQLHENPKPYEQTLAEKRAAEVKRLLSTGTEAEQLRIEDTARQTIIPDMLEAMKQQNVTCAVIDGFDIPLDKVILLSLTFQPFEIVLASDGYPYLYPTLEESERALLRQLASDPLNIGDFKATKACMLGNDSFDDRAYIRIKV